MVHHRILTLYSEKHMVKIYILDFHEADVIKLTRAANCSLKKEILTILKKILEKFNSYVKSYKTIYQKINEDFASAAKENREPKNFVIRFYHEPNSNMRRYNNPTCSDIAAILETANGAPPLHRCISVYKKEGTTYTIDHDSMHEDSMTYSLLEPKGEPGWQIAISTGGVCATKIRQNVTMKKYVAGRGSFNLIINASKLTQKIFVLLL